MRRRVRGDRCAIDGFEDVRAYRFDREPGVEIMEQRLAAQRPLLDDERFVRAAEGGELRLHGRKLALKRLDRRVEIFRPRAPELGKQRLPQARIDDPAEHAVSLPRGMRRALSRIHRSRSSP